MPALQRTRRRESLQRRRRSNRCRRRRLHLPSSSPRNCATSMSVRPCRRLGTRSSSPQRSRQSDSLGAWQRSTSDVYWPQDVRHCLCTVNATTVGGMSGNNDVGGQLRRLRLERGLSQERLAEAAGLSRDAVARIERGDRAPRVATLSALAEALDSSAAAVLAGHPGRLPRPDGSARLQRRVDRIQQVLATVPEDLADRIVRAIAVLCRPAVATSGRSSRSGRRGNVQSRTKRD